MAKPGLAAQIDSAIERVPPWGWWLAGGVALVGGAVYVMRAQQAHDAALITQAVQAQSSSDTAIVTAAEHAIQEVAASGMDTQAALGQPGNLFSSSQFANSQMNEASGIPFDVASSIMDQGPVPAQQSNPSVNVSPLIMPAWQSPPAGGPSVTPPGGPVPGARAGTGYGGLSVGDAGDFGEAHINPPSAAMGGVSAPPTAIPDWHAPNAPYRD